MRIEEINDTQFQDERLTGVRDEGKSWLFELEGGFCIGAGKVEGVNPKAGDTLRCYGKGLGFSVRGMAVNGNVLFYSSEEDFELKQQLERQEQLDKDRIEYEKNKDDFDRRLSVMPGPFQERIIGFRNANAEFWRHEPYEFFVCEEAVKFAGHFKASSTLLGWAKLDHDQQVAQFADLDQDHSGNTFSAAVRLAECCLDKPELVPMMHGALCPLVGCDDYGCYASRPNTAKP
jgi:hypothetical protein